MDHTSFPRRHGIDRDHLTRSDRLLSKTIRHGNERLVAPVFVPFDVEHYMSTPLRESVDDLVDKELEGVEGLPLLADDATSVWTGDLDRDALVFGDVDDLTIEAHPLEQSGDDLDGLLPFAAQLI
jgi:hypothetical protein